MSTTIPLSDLESYTQDRLVNTVGSPLDQFARVRGYNQIIQWLQSMANWDSTKRVITFDYLNGETDYSLVNDLGVSDYKDVLAIRDPDKAYERFDFVDETLFGEYKAEGRVTNAYCVEERDNAHILRMIYRNGNTKIQIAPLDSLTENGTWASDTSASDATTLAVDTTREKEGGGSLKFNISVSQSGNNKAAIRNTTLTALDLTDYQNIGHFRAWLDLQQLTAAQLALISSAEIRFGDDTSNYYAITVTTPLNGGTWKAGWNRVSWDWKNATTAGSPTVSSVNYFELIINYSASMTSANNARWDDLVLILPKEMEMAYFSEFMVNNGGTLQTEFSVDTVDTTEELLLPTRHRDTFCHLATEYLTRQMKNTDESQDWLYSQAKGTAGYKKLFSDLGHEIVRELPSVVVPGNAMGRSESRMWG